MRIKEAIQRRKLIQQLNEEYAIDDDGIHSFSNFLNILFDYQCFYDWLNGPI